MSSRRIQHGNRRNSPWGSVIEEDLDDEGFPLKRLLLVVVLGLVLFTALVYPGFACGPDAPEGEPAESSAAE